MSTPVPLRQLALGGLQRQQAREGLQSSEAWQLKNARPFKGKLETSPGRTAFIPDTLVGRPLKILAWEADNGDLKVNVRTHQKLYKIDPASGVLTDITRLAGDYTGSVDQMIDQVAAFNHHLSVNGSAIDNPQKWDGVAANASDIAGTPPKAGTITAALTYLLLGDTATSVRDIAWSDSGNFENWTTGDAGSLTLFQGPGRILRLLPLGETVIAYRLNSIHILFFVGAPFIWGQRQIVSNQGLVAPRAVVDLGGQHIYWGTDNVYLFNGANRKGIADKVIDEMKTSFDPSFRNNILAFADFTDREVYFVYPKAGDAGVPKQAWVWSWATGAWRQEDIVATAAGSWRRRLNDSWDNRVGTWDAQTDTWDQTQFLDQTPVVVIGTDAGKLNFIDTAVVDVLGVGRERLMETGLFNPGELIFNAPNSKSTLERLEIEQENKGTHNLEVWIGTQDTLIGDNTVSFTQHIIIADGSKRIVPVGQTARYFAIRFRTAGAAEGFRLSGVFAYFTKRGDR